jgi:sterol desaturase/sphingolipid hydroxylase (fatty acid hydroxylase superfamily)
MEANYTDIVILIAGLSLFGLEVLLLKKKKKSSISLNQTVLNLGLGMVERLTGIITINFGIYFFTALIPWRIVEPIATKWIAILIAFFAVDLMWYFYHRISHRISIIWAAHLIHHQSTEYNFSVNFAISPFGFFVRIFVYSILVLVGISPEYIILGNAINAFYQYLLHSELWPEFRGWEKVIVTPKFHQIHHSSVHQHIDTNYGGMFTIWDRIFGTYHFDDIPIQYGLTKPIEQQDPFHIQILFFMKLIKNFKDYSFKKAFQLLFLGPEAQSQDMPRIYTAQIQHHKLRIIIGFFIFLIGYVTLSFQLIPTWISFVIGMLGILICSGLAFIFINHKRLELTKNHA